MIRARRHRKKDVNAEAGEKIAMDDYDTAKANVIEKKINDKDKKCLCTAHSSSDIHNDDATKLVN